MNRRRFLSLASTMIITALAGCFYGETNNIHVDVISIYDDEKDLTIEIRKKNGNDLLFSQRLTVAPGRPLEATVIETSIDPGARPGAELDIEVRHSGRTESSPLTLDCRRDEFVGDAATIRIDTDGTVRLFSNQCYE